MARAANESMTADVASGSHRVNRRVADWLTLLAARDSATFLFLDLAGSGCPLPPCPAAADQRNTACAVDAPRERATRCRTQALTQAPELKPISTIYEELVKGNVVPQNVTDKLKDGSVAYTIFAPTVNATTKSAYSGTLHCSTSTAGSPNLLRSRCTRNESSSRTTRCADARRLPPDCVFGPMQGCARYSTSEASKISSP